MFPPIKNSYRIVDESLIYGFYPSKRKLFCDVQQLHGYGKRQLKLDGYEKRHSKLVG